MEGTMKARLRTFIDKIFFTPVPLSAGAHQATIDINGKPYRLHLRIEDEGKGILILNASTILHLNPTATEIAYHLIQNTPLPEIAASLAKRYQVTSEAAAEDIETFKGRLDTIIETPDLDPETFLDLERDIRHEPEKAAPLRLDCALTYQVPSGSLNLYTPVDRVKRLLDTEEWKTILKKAWDWGIPHVIFTGGEPTLRPDLVELVQYAQDLGQVTGLITDGLRLSDSEYRNSLLMAGLDHIMVLLDDKEDQSWESIKDLIQEDIHVTVHITITNRNKESIRGVILRLAEIGISHVSLSSPLDTLSDELVNASRLLAESHITLVEELPVPYNELNPVNLELEANEAAITGSGRSWLYVEPDGDVLPRQGVVRLLGNLLTDDWINISSNLKLYLSE